MVTGGSQSSVAQVAQFSTQQATAGSVTVRRRRGYLAATIVSELPTMRQLSLRWCCARMPGEDTASGLVLFSICEQWPPNRGRHQLRGGPTRHADAHRSMPLPLSRHKPAGAIGANVCNYVAGEFRVAQRYQDLVQYHVAQNSVACPAKSGSERLPGDNLAASLICFLLATLPLFAPVMAR